MTTLTLTEEVRLQGAKIIDADTHVTEPPDLWTSRTSGALRDRVPRIVDNGGQPEWVIEGKPMGFASGYATVRTDGGKETLEGFFNLSIYDVIAAASDTASRIRLMDEMGIFAQIVYPNMAGFGGERFASVQDEALKRDCVSIYNDAMAEMTEQSLGRLLPMALLPWWSVDASVVELRRSAEMGFRGVVMCSDPHLRGAPDLGDRAWDPFWEACCEYDLPVNFHIGASSAGVESFSSGGGSWPSMGRAGNMIVAGPAMFLNNGRVIMNMTLSGVLERFRELKIVSVESGVGWIPFMMEAIDHQHREEVAAGFRHLKTDPSEYIRDQVYACFFFERLRPELFESMREDNVMFETDFPHPTCLYPDYMATLEKNVEGLSDATVAKLVTGNAARLYKIPV